MFGVVVTGVKEAMDRLLGFKDRIAAEFETRVYECGWVIYTKSQYYVPVDTGRLKGSGRVEKKGSGFTTQITVAYGYPGSDMYGDSVPYALIVHEDLNFYHKPPTKARYLTDAYLETQPLVNSIMQRPWGTGVLGVFTRLFGQDQGPNPKTQTFRPHMRVNSTIF